MWLTSSHERKNKLNKLGCIMVLPKAIKKMPNNQTSICLYIYCNHISINLIQLSSWRWLRLFSCYLRFVAWGGKECSIPQYQTDIQADRQAGRKTFHSLCSTISDRHTSGQTGRPEDISLPVFHDIRQTYKWTDRQAGRHFTPCVPQYQTDIQADRQAGRKTFHSLCFTILCFSVWYGVCGLTTSSQWIVSVCCISFQRPFECSWHTQSNYLCDVSLCTCVETGRGLQAKELPSTIGLNTLS